jgi:predicted nucleotidyltransferase
MSDATLSTEQRQAVAELARSQRWRLVVLFGSTARAGKGRDVDLAVLPSGDVSLMEQGGWQARLEALLAPNPVDLLRLQAGPGRSPIHPMPWTLQCVDSGRCW